MLSATWRQEKHLLIMAGLLGLLLGLLSVGQVYSPQLYLDFTRLQTQRRADFSPLQGWWAAPGEDGLLVVRGQGPESVASFSLPPQVKRQLTLELALLLLPGRATAAPLRVLLNDTPVGELTVQAGAVQTFQLTLPAEAVRGGANQLKLVYGEVVEGPNDILFRAIRVYSGNQFPQLPRLFSYLPLDGMLVILVSGLAVSLWCLLLALASSGSWQATTPPGRRLAMASCGLGVAICAGLTVLSWLKPHQLLAPWPLYPLIFGGVSLAAIYVANRGSYAINLILYVALFVGYLVLRVRVLVGAAVLQLPDTASYVEMASLPVWDGDFFAGLRPFTVPLFYKLLGGDSVLVTTFQWALSVACWSALAVFVVRAVRSQWLKPIALGAVLTFSLSAQIIQWDRVMYTESISLSLLALFVACWLWLLEGWRWRKAVLLVLIAFLWAFARDANAYVVLMAAGLLLAVVAVRRSQRRYLVVAGAFVVIFIASNASANAGQRWVFPFLNVLARRVLPNSYQTAYFAELGMPVSPALTRLSGTWADYDDRAFYEDPALEDFRRWMYERGKGTYMRYLVSHPAMTFQEPLDNLEGLLSTSSAGYRPEGFSPPLGGWLEEVVYPRKISLLCILVAGVLGFALGIAVCKRPQTAWLVPLTLLLLAYPVAMLVWHGDAMEIARHSLQFNVQLRLGSWLLLLFAADVAADV